VSIVVPTYNEASNIGPLLKSLAAAMRGERYEIIVVDDGSPDGTGAIVDGLAGSYPLRVLHRGGRRGLASALLDGFGAAKGELLACMDADLSHPPEVIPRLVAALQEERIDIAIASRLVPGGGVMGSWPQYRRLNSYVATLLASSLTGVKDSMSGCFALKRGVIEGIPLVPRGYKLLLEILVRGNYREAKEVPFIFDNRCHGESKLTARVKLDYLIQVCRLHRDRFALGRRRGRG
jgi:dolichol-phosphate mannosyltransferase